MKLIKMIPQEFEVTHVKVSLAVRYEEEDIPNDFPMRKGDIWEAKIEVDTGKIVGWPAGKSGELHMKVCDEGSYAPLNAEGITLAEIEQNYVPHGLIPGEYGDYVEFNIDEDGVITNWPKNPSFKDFTEEKDEY